MKTASNGVRYKNNRLWETRLHAPYDYVNDGLLRHMMSPRIVNSQNPVLQYIIKNVEASLVFAMQYIDILQNCFNYNWKNR